MSSRDLPRLAKSKSSAYTFISRKFLETINSIPERTVEDMDDEGDYD
jgi:hypothetical protein